jgi:hypothetical protein
VYSNNFLNFCVLFLLANYDVNSTEHDTSATTVSLEARSPVLKPHSQTSGGDTRKVRATESNTAVGASKPTHVVEKRKIVETLKPQKKRKSGKLSRFSWRDTFLQ